MKSPLKIGLNLMTLGLIGLGIYTANRAEAIDTLQEGYRISGTREINTPEGCIIVVNPGPAIFAPTKTWAEWNSFKAAAPKLGISVNVCPPPPPPPPPRIIFGHTGGGDSTGDGGTGDGGGGCGGSGGGCDG